MAEPSERDVGVPAAADSPAPPIPAATLGLGMPLETADSTDAVPQQDAAAGQPQQTETVGTPPEEPASEPGEHQPPPQQVEQAGGVAGEASSEKPSESGQQQLPEMMPPPPPQAVQEESAPVQEKTRARRLWDRLRDAVHRQFHRAKTNTAAPPTAGEGKGRDTKPEEPDDGSNNKHKEEEEGKDEGETQEEGKSERDDAAFHFQSVKMKKKKLQKAGKLVQYIMSWYNRHRSRSRHKDSPVQEDDKDGGETTEPTSGQEKVTSDPAEKTKPHPKWAEEEKRLQDILEQSFTRLLVTEYREQLNSTRRKCLLTFSVFELACQVKKQAMLYWWVSQFRLPNTKPAPDSRTAQSPRRDDDDDAESVLSRLSDLGFLEPIKNYCCGAIHGCKVNPLVHWMVKRLARDDRFADLGRDGRPTCSQTTSSILCLTAGYRNKLQQMRIAELQALSVPNTSRTRSKGGTDESSTQTQGAPIEQIKGKQVIINVDAHVYPFSTSLLEHLSDCLTVLQLGRWCHHDDNTYMEVDGLESESVCALNKLKNIRYLSLRGLSRLSKLPCGIHKLKSLEVLDMRGCQNLVTVKDISQLRRLTHLDLTECYMLEHISRDVTSLTNLQVFKGFIFGSGTQRDKRCRIQDLQKLIKLQKLTISITTDASIRQGDLAALKHLKKLQSLTITWSEIPGILEDDSDQINPKKDRLLKAWTSFELPQGLEKLDLRCYPKKLLELTKDNNNLNKLYLRGGEVEKFSIPKPNFIRTLRLRYLKKFDMKWNDIISMLNKIENVEIRIKYIDFKENDKKYLQKDIENEQEIIEKMMIPKCILDENGVWMKDNKEEENRQGIIDQSSLKINEEDKKKGEAQGASETSKGFSEPLSEAYEVPSVTKYSVSDQFDP